MNCTDHLSELKALRLQVADLTRALAERDQSLSAERHQLEETIQDLREQSHRFRAIVEGTAAETGDEFFTSLVRHLTSTLHVQYALIGTVNEGQPKKIRTIAVSSGGTLVDNFEYDLIDIPCATALTETCACFDRDVQAMFPQFRRLADLGAESYCAVPLRTKGGAVIGLLAVMDTKPLQQGDDLQSLLGVFAPRVAAEFERKRAEQEPTKALADLYNVVETVPDIMFTLDTQGNMSKWNRRVVDVTGYSPEELLNKPALAFVPPEEQPRTAEAIQRAFTEGYAELDGYLLTKDHRIIPYHWTGALLKSPQGDPIGITGVGRDVSDKKRAENELKQQRRHLVEAQALAHLGSWYWDIETGEVELSDELFRIFGYEPGAIVVTYERFLASLHQDDHAPVVASINDALLGNRFFDVEYRIVRPNGGVRFIHARGDVNRDVTGHPISMAGTVLDITERKQVEDALRASEERWQLAVRGSNDGIWDWNIQSGDIFFSPRWKAMRGLEDHEITNHVDEWRSRVHPDDLDRVLQSIDAYLAKQRPEFREEYRVQRKDGSYIWILDRGVALWADDGTPTRMAGSETDITARKTSEEALVRSRDLLNSFVEHTPAGVAMLDKSLRYVAVSRRWMEDYRLGCQQVIGRHHYDVFPEIKELKEWQEIHQRCLLGAVERRDEDRFARADGSEDWLRWEVRPWHDITGEIGGIIMFTEVITERKQTEEALIRSEHQLRTVLDALPVGVWFTDQSGRPVLSNPAAKQIWTDIKQVGIETTGDNSGWWETVGPSDTFHRWALSQSLTKGIPSLNETLDLECLDGRIRTIRNTTVPVQGPNGDILGAIVLNEDLTALRQMQGALKLTQSSVDHAVEGFLWIDSDARILNVNDATCRMLEYTRDELTTMTVHDIDPNFSQELWPAHWETLKRNGSMTFESKHWSKTGRVLDTEVTVTCLEYGGAQYSCAIVRDIGERKRAEAAMRQSEERYRSLVDNAPIGIFLEEEERFVYANREMQRILKAQKIEELIGMPVLDRITPEFHQRVNACVQEMIDHGRPAPPFDEQFVRLDGSRVDVAVTAIPISIDGRSLVQTLVLDISERKQAEEALRRSHGFLRQVIDIFPNFIFAKDRAGRFRLANQAVADTYGIPADQLIGKTDADFNLNPHEVEFFRLKDLEVMDTLQEQFIPEEAITDSSGKIRWLQTVKRPILDEQGSAIMVLGAATDITDRKGMEEALRQREHDLRAAIEERERISQDLHDGILQSLFAIGLALESAKSRMSPRTRKISGVPLDQAIEQLNRVMQEIRNFIAGLGSDLLKGKDLSTAMQQMLDSLTQHHAIRVGLAVEDRALQVLSTQQSLHLLLVIQEAVSNCIRHGRAQEARVSLKMMKQGVRLSIRDNGSGFNPKVVRQIGHGLSNMAIRAKKIGGRFTVSSKINEGTRIVVDLPKKAALASH